VNEDGETASSGHPNAQFALRPETYEISPLGECGVAFKALSHCPRL
jgi:hypothetical protein